MTLFVRVDSEIKWRMRLLYRTVLKVNEFFHQLSFVTLCVTLIANSVDVNVLFQFVIHSVLCRYSTEHVDAIIIFLILS